MDTHAEQLLSVYIEKVKEHIPDFIKNNTSRYEDILSRIELDLKGKALVRAGSLADVTEAIMAQVIDEAGKPHRFITPYLQRGTPRIFITDELMPLYKKVLFSAGIIIVVIILILNLLKIGNENGGAIFADTLGGIISGLTILFTAVTAAFFGLSKMGIFPEDLRRGFMQEVSSRRNQDSEEGFGKKAPGDSKNSFKHKKIEDIVGGILGILFGMYLFLGYPLGIINDANPLFLEWLGLFGLFILVKGIFNVGKTIATIRGLWARRIVYATAELLNIFAIPLFLWLRQNVGIVPGFGISDNGLMLKVPSDMALTVIYWVCLGIVIAHCIAIISGVARSLTMKEE